MTDFDVCLSSAAIQTIVTDKIEGEFEFLFGSQKYNCPRMMAEFLSARVRLSHSVDPSIAEYFVETSDLNDEFQLFLSLGFGSTIRVTKDNLDFFVCLSRELGNSDFYISLIDHFDTPFIVSQIGDSITLDLFSEALFGCLSSNFCGLAWSEFDAIPVSVLFHILSYDLLRISSEDDLFWYISSRICSDPEYFDLLQLVHFEYISSECVSCFLSAVPDSIDRRFWESISLRLISQVAHEVEFPLNEPRSLNGIISYLTQKHGGNVHDTGIVTITASDMDDDPRYTRKNVADLTFESQFISKDHPGQWVCWDFHEMRVRPTHYTITAGWLKSWVVESSLDGEAWTETHRKTDDEDFRGMLGTASFAVLKSAECRFIRLTQTGKSYFGYDQLAIWACEFFGTLLERRA
jgi:hypothetical protein